MTENVTYELFQMAKESDAEVTRLRAEIERLTKAQARAENADCKGAMDLLTRMGWGPNSRLSPHSVCQLMERYAEEKTDKFKLGLLDVEDGAEAISEENARLRAELAQARAGQEAADLALQEIGMSLGTTDEWTDQTNMIVDVKAAVAQARAEIERLTKALADLAGWAMSAAKNELPASLIRANDILAATSASIGFATIWNAPGIGPMFTQLCTRVSGGCAKDAEIARLTKAIERAEQDFDKVADAYLRAGNNQGAGALQYASRYMSDVLAALKEQDHG